ncbi:LGFP repeat-containing protein [Kitasatospora sp. NPDC056181]|uniref:LGFP repeat-containing protein n=1 Tax=Kitasatospora sp. NPDC056181 TaxID=3345737 RepID=UPI0035E2960F
MFVRRLLLPVVMAVTMIGGITVANAAPAPSGWRATRAPKSQVTPGQMRSDHEAVPRGFSKADADRAETLEARRDAAPGCQVYWPAPYEVCGAIRDKYNELGGPNSFLSFPKSDELTNPDGSGKRTEFVNGPIYWSPQGGAHPVVNHFFAAWARNGYEAGPLGYPTSDEAVNPDGIGRRQYFEHGTVYWKLNEAYAVLGAIRDKWGEAGWEGGYLGYPVSDEFGTPDGIGRATRFEHGMIYWTGAYGAHPVSGGLLDKWSLSGYERGPYGYPVADQRPRGSSWDQDFQFGTMGFPTDPAAASDPEGGDAEPTVDDTRPVTWPEFAADARLGEGAPITQDKAISLAPCTSGRSCIQETAASAPRAAEDDDPVIDGPDDQASFVPGWCTYAPWDGVWRATRKNACSVERGTVVVYDTKGSQVGAIPFVVKTGILSSHRSGEMNQELRVEFGEFTGTVGTPTFQYQPDYAGHGTDAYSIDGPASGKVLKPKETKVVILKWKEQSAADQAVWNTDLKIVWSLGNLSPDVTPTTEATVRYTGFRCDSTLKASRAGYRQGCVVPYVTPQLELTGSIPEQTGHVQEAIRSGLPGAVGRPLHRLAEKRRRDFNRQTSCPGKGKVRDGRRLPDRECDEYPFASTYEGAALTNGPGRTVHENCHIPDLTIITAPTGYSVCMIDGKQNSAGGNLLGLLYGNQRIIDQDAFTVSASGGTPPPKP